MPDRVNERTGLYECRGGCGRQFHVASMLHDHEAHCPLVHDREPTCET